VFGVLVFISYHYDIRYLTSYIISLNKDEVKYHGQSISMLHEESNDKWSFIVNLASISREKNFYSLKFRYFCAVVFWTSRKQKKYFIPNTV